MHTDHSAVSVNGRVIPEAAIEREARFHRDAPSPDAAAAAALAVRELLVQQARALAIDCDDEEEAIERLLEREAQAAEPTSEECRRYYDGHPESFVVGEIVEASHILFAVMPDAPVDAIRRQAEAVLRQAAASPERFGALAREFSNCPSAAQDGSLGQLTRGATVPEFERAVFEGEASGVLPHVVATRHGFHVVHVARRVAGRRVDFEIAQPRIAGFLRRRAQAQAAQRYVRALASSAALSGVDLGATGSPLVQ